MADRREFLKATMPLAASALLRPAGANDRIRVGIVGVKSRGYSLLKSLLDMRGDNVEVVALCDVDALVLGQRTTEFAKLSGGQKVAAVTDMRHLLDDKSI